MRTCLLIAIVLLGASLMGCKQKTAAEIVGDEAVTEEPGDANAAESEAGAAAKNNETAEKTRETRETRKTVQAESTKQAAAPATDWQKTPGVYARFITSKGEIVCRLFPKKTPVTVKNFIGLAKGTKEWTDPKTGKQVKRPFYDGLIFHRVIPNFMIQGGDPLGNGTGGPGYKFKDEFDPSLRFDKKGKLAMANAGPNTNGSQFFITVAPTPHLNNHHTIFGEVVSGQDVADAISKVPTGANDRPLQDVVIKTVKIVHVAKKAKA